jgi:hypothetical protein
MTHRCQVRGRAPYGSPETFSTELFSGGMKHISSSPLQIRWKILRYSVACRWKFSHDCCQQRRLSWTPYVGCMVLWCRYWHREDSAEDIKQTWRLVEHWTVNREPVLDFPAIKGTFVVVDHELFSMVIRTVPLHRMYRSYRFLAKVKATTSG